MRKNGKKVVIKLLIAVILLAVLAGSFAYIYFYTDMLMSDQKLFAKYLMQNIVELNDTISTEKINNIEEKLKESKYEENITISYTEPEEVEPIGEIAIDIQNDSIDKKIYWILSLMIEGIEDSLEIEYIEENNMYSLRFTDAVKEFVSIENDNLKQLAAKFGIDEETINLRIPDTIDFEKFSIQKLKFTEDEKNTEINRYFKLLYNNISENKYQKNEKTLITVNGKTIETNAYILTLNMEDIKNLKIKILDTLKQDEIVLEKLKIIDEMFEEFGVDSIKDSFINNIQKEIDYLNKEEIIENENFIITVYEQDKKTVRIKAEKGLECTTIDTYKIEDKKQIDIKYTTISEENQQLSNKLTFIEENDNKLSVKLNNAEGEEQHNVNLSVELTENENNTKIDIIILQGENKIAFTKNIKIVDKINYNVKLDETNNKVLNGLSEEKISYILDILGKRLETEYVKPLRTALESIIMKNAIEGILGAEESIINSEINIFNNQFEVYEGERKSSEIKMLLDTVYLHNSLEKQKNNPRYVTITGDISLEKDEENIENIKEGSYTVKCLYKDSFINQILVLRKSEI